MSMLAFEYERIVADLCRQVGITDPEVVLASRHISVDEQLM